VSYFGGVTTSVSKAKTSNSETSNDKVEMPKIKTVRMSEPIIEEWESDNEDDEIVVKPKEVTKTVKPSFEKIESVNARNETIRQAENPRKNNKSPRGNKRNWNGMMTQKLASPGNTSSNFLDDLTKDLLASLALSPFYDDPYMKVVQAYDAIDNELPIPPQVLIAPPTILPPSPMLSLSPMFDFPTFLSSQEDFTT
ncbi:hypothetical protein Tco_0036371, partial [Tanacetum coccineum]